MAGALRRTMIYLGLADGEEYDHEQGLPSHQVKEKTVVSDEKATEKRAEFHAPVTPIKRSSANEAGMHQIITVHPRSYNDAKIVGESFRDGIPVVMNVTDMGEADAKRLVDFAAGLVFGMRGSIERVTNKVFLLSPSFVEVLGEDKKGAEVKANVFNQS